MITSLREEEGGVREGIIEKREERREGRERKEGGGEREDGTREKGEGGKTKDQRHQIPASVSKVLILVFDAGVDDTSMDVVLFPVVAQLTEPVEVIL